MDISNRNALIGAVLILAGGATAMAVAPRFYGNGMKQVYIQKPDSCAEIVNGGVDDGMEYLFCKTADGYSLFMKKLSGKEWEERRYR